MKGWGLCLMNDPTLGVFGDTLTVDTLRFQAVAIHRGQRLCRPCASRGGAPRAGAAQAL
eukprot:COSAG04_NODE_10740_length_756_cov_1.112633_1_plen_58_part_10